MDSPHAEHLRDSFPHRARWRGRLKSISKRVVGLCIEYCEFRIVVHGVEKGEVAAGAMCQRELARIAIVKIPGFKKWTNVTPSAKRTADKMRTHVLNDTCVSRRARGLRSGWTGVRKSLL